VSARVRIDGRDLDPDDIDRQIEGVELRRRIASGEGEFFNSETGEPYDLLDQNRLRAQFTAGDAGERLQLLSEQAAELAWSQPRVALFPGLMDVDQHSILLGQKASGKSRLGMDIFEAAVTPGHRLFGPTGPVGPANLGPNDRIVFFNAEDPVALVEEMVERRGMNGEGRRPFDLHHLARMGGPSILDVINNANFDAWAANFSKCTTCPEVVNFQVPKFVIVNGLTAILGEKEERYGEWSSAWVELMAFVGIPNSLVIAHSTYDGEHPLGDTTSWTRYNGVWFFTKTKAGVRRFRTDPRFDDVHRIEPFIVVLGADGRQYPAEPKSSRAQGVIGEADETERTSAKPSLADTILSFLEEHPNSTGSAIRDGVRGDDKKIDSTLGALVGSGRVVREARQAPGGGWLYRVPLTGQEPDETKESK